MEKYEYLRLFIRDYNLEKELDELGGKGWGVLHIEKSGDRYIVVLSRKYLE